MKNRLAMISLTMCLCFAGSLIAFGQQPQGKAPVVTAEDVLRVSRGSARANPPKTPVAEPTVEPQTQRNTFTDTERAWNERLKIAQQRVKELDRRADATELEVNRFRNVLFSPERRSSQEHKGLIAEIDNLTIEMRRLRTEAAAARVVVEDIFAEGQARGFRVSAAALISTSSVSTVDSYRSRYNEVQTELSDKQRRAEVLQLRTNNLSSIVLLNSRTGDEFYNNRVRDNLRDTQEELYAMLASVIATREKMEQLRQEARAAGVILN